MDVRTIGDDLLTRDEKGNFALRIATVFPRHGTIVTRGPIHAIQREEFLKTVRAERAAAGQPPLSEEDELDLLMTSVDLLLDPETILIRPDTENMPLAFEADELLQQLVSKRKIKFQHALNPRVREAIKRRGEMWRIAVLPRTIDQMCEMIEGSCIGIEGRPIYFYNRTSGTRLLTFDTFNALHDIPALLERRRQARRKRLKALREKAQQAGTPLPPPDDAPAAPADEAPLSDQQKLGELRTHLLEIRDYADRTNRQGMPEIDFFQADGQAVRTALHEHDLEHLADDALLTAYHAIVQRFYTAAAPDARADDTTDAHWRARMYAALIGQTDKAISEESLIGLADEFFMQVEWLPGGRIEDGELMLDTLFDEESTAGYPADLKICDEKARGFIFNFIRDYGDLEYVNIGRVVGSLSQRQALQGRRGVYLAEIRHSAAERPVLRIIRLQKWGVREHLDEGKDLLRAILESEEYTEYILDRRLGCRQLGMNLSRRVTARKISEIYAGLNRWYQGLSIWTAYFERDYVPGLATDEIPSARFADRDFAVALARVLGRAAAPNIITGRTDIHGRVIFDDGDELVVENVFAIPVDILVADHTGTFQDYRRTLGELAPAYANAINKRAAYLPDVRAFADAFLDGFVQRFKQIQHDYRKRKRAFDTLFKHQHADPAGNFCFRWESVLLRVATANPDDLAAIIRQHIQGL